MSEQASSILLGCLVIGSFGALVVASLRTRKLDRTATQAYDGSGGMVVASGDAGTGHSQGHGCGDHGGGWGGDCGGHGGGH